MNCKNNNKNTRINKLIIKYLLIRFMSGINNYDKKSKKKENIKSLRFFFDE